MDWVRCNSCFFQPAPHTKRSLYLTSCGHIVCSNCCTHVLSNASGHSAPNTLPACLVCHKHCSLALLGKQTQMNKDIMFYFTDPVAVLKKLLQAAEFQRMNYEKHSEWQKRKRILIEFAKTRKQYQSVAIVQSHLEANHHRLLQVLEALRQKGALAGIKSRLSCLASESERTNPQTPMDTDPPHLRTHTSSGQSSQGTPSNTRPLMTSGQLTNNERIHNSRRVFSGTTPRGSLSSTVVTPSSAVRPSLMPNLSNPGTNRQQSQSPHLQSTPGYQSASRNLPPLGNTLGHLQPVVQTEKGVYRDPRVAMNLLSQYQMQKQAQRHSQSTSTTNTPSMFSMPQSVQQRDFSSATKHSLLTSRTTSAVTAKHTVHRMIPNVGQLRTPLSVVKPNSNIM